MCVCVRMCIHMYMHVVGVEGETCFQNLPVESKRVVKSLEMHEEYVMVGKGLTVCGAGICLQIRGCESSDG